MPPISMKKIGIGILIILALSRLDCITNAIHQIYELFADWLSPLQNTPPPGRVALAALILALIYITIFKIVQERIRKK
ncbi:hypothetical protein ACFL5F_08025 [Planctomycetota bacterium]